MADMDDLDAAVRAVEDGHLVVYPTETVYGLGGNALDPAAIERVYDVKGRDRENPLSFAVSALDDLERFVSPSPETRRFMDAFLPGPVTVICRRQEILPLELTGGSDRVGVRIPAHEFSRALLARTPPLTATSANPSGGASAREPAELDESIRAEVAVVLDGGRSEGLPSTVVDVDRGVIHRRGAFADAVEAWLDQADSRPSP